jgi:hypothetical protein
MGQFLEVLGHSRGTRGPISVGVRDRNRIEKGEPERFCYGVLRVSAPPVPHETARQKKRA